MKLDELIAELKSSGLIPSSDLQAVVDRLTSRMPVITSAALLHELANCGLVTSYQREQLALGRGKELVLGNYVVLDRVGQGGMGIVLKAQHRRMKRIVALKMLRSEVSQSPELVRRFQREVEAVARLSHPNIVLAHDADEADRGKEDRLSSVSLPSEPDGRVSRVRLSG